MQFYLDQGWPLEVLLHLFVREVEIYEGDRRTAIMSITPERRQSAQFLKWVRELSRCELYLGSFNGPPTFIGPRLAAIGHRIHQQAGWRCARKASTCTKRRL